VATIGTGVGYLITGLPFPVNGSTPGSVAQLTNGAAAVVYAGIYAPAGSTQLITEGLVAAGPNMGTAVLFANGTAMLFTLTYQTLAP
jgi:hypothetical protein